MGVEVTPLGFRLPDGNQPVRTGDNDIANNGRRAQELFSEQRAQIANLLASAGFSGDPLALNDVAIVQAINTRGSETAVALAPKAKSLTQLSALAAATSRKWTL